MFKAVTRSTRKREVLRVPESTGLRDIDVVMTPVFAPDAKTVRFVTIVAIDVTCDETDLATGASRARPGDDRLSERRRQVLTRVAQGCSNREIATELGISVRTVESHRQHVAKQLGVSSRADFFRYASEHGYV